MSCPLCRQRKARRACPALQQNICSVCCGTKRLVEIRCPATCVYLTNARTHPAAAVLRRQERDVEVLAPLVQGLSEPQSQLFLLLHSVIREADGDALVRLRDVDVADAAGALAATLETAGRGIIYEHQPSSLPAQRLVRELQSLLARLSQRAGRSLDHDGAVVLRRIEKGARAMPAQPGGAGSAYVELVSRVLQHAASAGQADVPGEGVSDQGGVVDSGLVSPSRAS